MPKRSTITETTLGKCQIGDKVVLIAPEYGTFSFNEEEGIILHHLDILTAIQFTGGGKWHYSQSQKCKIAR